MRHLKIALLLLLSFSLGATEKVTRDIPRGEIEKLEQKANELIESKNVSREKLFYLYALGARNISRYEGFEDYAEKYYLKALENDVVSDADRMRVMLELGWLYRNNNMNDKLSGLLDDIRKDASGSLTDAEKKALTLTADYFQVIASGKTVKEAIGKNYWYFFGSAFDLEIVHHELQTLMKEGRFKEAHAIFVNDRVKDTWFYDTVVSFDLLNTVDKKGADSILRCQSRIKDSTKGTLVTDICQQLVHMKRTGKPDRKGFESLLARTTEHPEYEYMGPVLRKILNP